ncbi:hypothetical protein C5167_040027, partial [Papaver somniferum]
MKSYRLSKLSKTEVDSLKARPRIDFSAMFSTLDPAVKQAFDVAYDNIAFHFPQKLPSVLYASAYQGALLLRVFMFLGELQFYLQLYSRYEIVVLATPPGKDGSICKEVVYCAKKAFVTHSYLKAGGAQAISAMAWGTSSCPKVEKIAGPGNQYVTAAKQHACGPSEVLVIADKLASQAEHGPDCRGVLVIAGDGGDVDAIEKSECQRCRELGG